MLVESQSAIETLIASIPCNSDKLLKFTLRLMFNLSFDPAIRERMMKQSMLPKLVELLKRPPFRALTIRILYHLSFDDRCKSMFSYTDAIPIVMQLVIHFPQPMVARELAALAINLTLNARNAELIVQKKDTVRALFSRVQKTRDVLLFKVGCGKACALGPSRLTRFTYVGATEFNQFYLSVAITAAITAISIS